MVDDLIRLIYLFIYLIKRRQDGIIMSTPDKVKLISCLVSYFYNKIILEYPEVNTNIIRV
jgi:hypothetical protein